MFGQVVRNMMGGVNLTGAEGNAVLYGGRRKQDAQKTAVGNAPDRFCPVFFPFLLAPLASSFLPGVKNGSLGGLAFFLRHACV